MEGNHVRQGQEVLLFPLVLVVGSFILFWSVYCYYRVTEKKGMNGIIDDNDEYNDDDGKCGKNKEKNHGMEDKKKVD